MLDGKDPDRQAFYRAVALKTVSVREEGGKLVGTGPGDRLEEFKAKLHASGEADK